MWVIINSCKSPQHTERDTTHQVYCPLVQVHTLFDLFPPLPSFFIFFDTFSFVCCFALKHQFIYFSYVCFSCIFNQIFYCTNVKRTFKQVGDKVLIFTELERRKDIFKPNQGLFFRVFQLKFNSFIFWSDNLFIFPAVICDGFGRDW